MRFSAMSNQMRWNFRYLLEKGSVQTLFNIGARSPKLSIGIYAFKYPIDDIDLL